MKFAIRITPLELASFSECNSGRSCASSMISGRTAAAIGAAFDAISSAQTYSTILEDAESAWSTTLTKHVRPRFCNPGTECFFMIIVLVPLFEEDAGEVIEAGTEGG